MKHMFLVFSLKIRIMNASSKDKIIYRQYSVHLNEREAAHENDSSEWINIII